MKSIYKTTKKCLQTLPSEPWGAKSPPLENHWIRGVSAALNLFSVQGCAFLSLSSHSLPRFSPAPRGSYQSYRSQKFLPWGAHSDPLRLTQVRDHRPPVSESPPLDWEPPKGSVFMTPPLCPQPPSSGPGAALGLGVCVKQAGLGRNSLSPGLDLTVRGRR